MQNETNAAAALPAVVDQQEVAAAAVAQAFHLPPQYAAEHAEYILALAQQAVDGTANASAWIGVRSDVVDLAAAGAWSPSLYRDRLRDAAARPEAAADTRTPAALKRALEYSARLTGAIEAGIAPAVLRTLGERAVRSVVGTSRKVRAIEERAAAVAPTTLLAVRAACNGWQGFATSPGKKERETLADMLDTAAAIAGAPRPKDRVAQAAARIAEAVDKMRKAFRDAVKEDDEAAIAKAVATIEELAEYAASL